MGKDAKLWSFGCEEGVPPEPFMSPDDVAFLSDSVRPFPDSLVSRALAAPVESLRLRDRGKPLLDDPPLGVRNTSNGTISASRFFLDAPSSFRGELGRGDVRPPDGERSMGAAFFGLSALC